MYTVKGAPFRYKGSINVEDCKTSEEVMIKAGLNWNVAKCELFGKMPLDINDTNENIDNALQTISDVKADGGHVHGTDVFRVCKNAFATYRTDINVPLGVVKNKYTPVQNTEAFKFFDDAIGKNSAIWQTAGYFGYGERIFVSAKLPNNILVKGDPVDNYLVFTNNHDGGGGVKILFTPIRVICQNTLNAAIKTTSNYVSFRHTTNVHNKISIAQEILGISKVKSEEVGEYYNYLAGIKVTDNDVMEFICNNFLTEEESVKLNQTGHTVKEVIRRNNKAVIDAGISTRKLNVITDTWDYYLGGIGQREIAGTAWGAVNAISGYYSNVDNIEGIKRLDSLLYGDKSRKVETALALAGEL